MRYRRWVFPTSLAILVIYAILFSLHGRLWIFVRQAALSFQFPTALTYAGPGLIIAVMTLGLTVVFGRWYCMILCPMGTVQEIISRFIGKRRKLGFLKMGPAWLVPVLLAGSFFLFSSAVLLINPVGIIAIPAAYIMEVFRTYGIAAPLSLGLGFLAVVALCTYFAGRIFCRICPVGFLLGTAASLGVKMPAINPKRCISCGKCENICPARCANAQGKTIHSVHCLSCGECTRVCPTEAIVAQGKVSPERRTFLGSALGVGAAGLYAATRPLADSLGIASHRPIITPPGTHGDTPHRNRCIACMACVAACPSKIIRPLDAGRPGLDMDYGFCHYNCHDCGTSCPAGVFTRGMTLEEKRVTRIARTEFVMHRCVVFVNGTECGACAEVCPTHAVRMREERDGVPGLPDFDPDYCIGCGACKHVCPAPGRAFVVEGLARHERSQGVRPPEEGDEDESWNDSDPASMADFPF